VKLALAVVVALAGCSKDREPAPAADPAPPRPSVAADAAAPKPIDSPKAIDSPRFDAASPQALFAAYQAAHAGATTANPIDTGRRIWPLLSADARDMVTKMSTETIGKLGPTAIKVSPEDIGYKVLGETAAVRAQAMPTATIVAARALTKDRTTLDIKLGGEHLELVAVREGASWRLAAGPGLVVSDTEVFRAPSGREAPAGAATVDEAAAKFRDVLARGTGWDAYNMMSPANRERLLALMGQMGGTGAGDVAKVFEKTIADRRRAGITVVKAEVTDRTADAATVVLSYSNGASDRFHAVRVDGKWWLEMPI